VAEGHKDESEWVRLAKGSLVGSWIHLSRVPAKKVVTVPIKLIWAGKGNGEEEKALGSMFELDPRPWVET
jgi:hypothetical protein